MAVAAPFIPEQHVQRAHEIEEKAAWSKARALSLIEAAGGEIDSAAGDEIGTFLAWWKSNSRTVEVWSETDEAEYARLVAQVSACHEAHLVAKYGVGDLTAEQRNFVYASIWGNVPLFYLRKDEARYAEMAAFALGFAKV